MMCKLKFTSLRFAIAALSIGLAVPPLSQAEDQIKSAAPAVTTSNVKLGLKAIAAGFERPTDIAFLGDELYVSLQRGHIVQVDIERHKPGNVIIDLESETNSDAAKGLLGFAFDPKYAETNKVFVHYTASAGGIETRVSALTIPVDGSTANATYEKKMIRLVQPTPKHLGGHIAFGPDGKLYFGIGDGGEVNDPRDRAQKVSDLFGSVIRIDATERQSTGYSSPSDNPGTTSKGWNPDIWTTGMRNPSSLTFDPATQLLYVADTGSGAEQEIDKITKGANYGWSIFDGNLCRRMRLDCMNQDYEPPLISFPVEKIAGLVLGPFYNGKELPNLVGTLLYADRPTGRIFGLKIKDGKVTENQLLLTTDKEISTFGVDKNGEVLLADYKSGKIFKLASAN